MTGPENRQDGSLFQWELERGMIAYEAYRRACAGVDPETRAPLKDWRELHTDLKQVWVLVAEEICARFGAIF